MDEQQDAANRAPPDTPGVVFPPPLIIAGTLVLALWADKQFDLSASTSLMPMSIGTVAILIGLGLITTSLGLFRRAKTRPEPWQPSANLIQGGAYRFTRNPMYLGMFVAYAGIAIASYSLLAIVALVPLFILIDRTVVAREEAYLTRQFGERYVSYSNTVRRWL